MSTAEIVNLPSSNRVAIPSQATAIEQSRAIAEVQAMVVVAQQCKRDVTAALSEIRSACAQPALANKAFFRYARAGSQITGPSIHLARELARCWGNINYGITELSRDSVTGTSEMSAWAWDLQTNTRNSNTFIAPHKRDTKAGAKDIVDLRDVYENNANLGARRVREAIFAVMPEWVVEDAKERCLATVANPGDGKTTAQRASDIIKAFADMGVRQAQLEQKIGLKVSDWTDHDVASLKVIGGSLRRNETTVADEFTAPAQQRVTAAEIKQQAAPAAARPTWAGHEVQVAAKPSDPMLDSQLKRMQIGFKEKGYTDPVDRHMFIEQTLDLPADSIASSGDITSGQCEIVISALAALNG
jgi:hypothetical protein